MVPLLHQDIKNEEAGDHPFLLHKNKSRIPAKGKEEIDGLL